MVCVFFSFYWFGQVLKFKLLCVDDSSELTKMETTLGLSEPNWLWLSQTFKLESTTSEMLQKQECNCTIFDEKLLVEGQIMSAQECLHKRDSSDLVLLEELV